MTLLPLPAGPYAALGLSAPLSQAAAASGYLVPSAIQCAAIPAVLARADVWATAPTGSGKTAAYALPLLQCVDDERRAAAASAQRVVRGLVLLPTREVAVQVAQHIRHWSQPLADRVKVVTAYGGASINSQMMALRGGADVVVATPGRLLDLVAQRALRLDGVTICVLDEADRLLDDGFDDELGRVLALLPVRRQTLLFSATDAPAVRARAAAVLHQPVRLEVQAADAVGEGGPAATPLLQPDIAQRAIHVMAGRRTALLHHLIRQHRWSRVLVFVATRHASDHVARKLCDLGVAAAAWHGERSQGFRSRALADFQSGRVQVLVATDLAARGIHIEGLPAVVNHDLPRSAIEHLHRIGRTGRAGESGCAVSFVCADVPGAEAHFRLIEKRQAQRVPREVVPGFEPPATALLPAGAACDAGGIKGRRKSKKDKLRELAAP